MIKAFFKKLPMITCREASILMSQAMDKPLSLKERIRLKTHLTVCAGCLIMSRQFQQMRALLRAYQNYLLRHAGFEPGLRPDAKEKMKQDLRLKGT